MRKGFTLIELLVVVGMIAVILGALTTSVSKAQERARIQKATSDVKVISQAILAYENYNRSGDNYKLPTLEKQDADSSSLGFLLGNGGSAESGGEIPVLLMASLHGQGKILDPWGHPYKVTIREGGGSSMGGKAKFSSTQINYSLPNFYRLGKGERNLEDVK